MAARTNALHNFLPEVAAFLEMQSVHLLGFLRERVLGNLAAVPRHEVLYSDCLRVFRRGRDGARAFHRRDGLIFTLDGAVDANAMRACCRNGCDEEIAAFHVREAMMRRGEPALRRDFGCLRALKSQRKRFVRDVCERHIVGDDVAIQMLENRPPRFRIGVEKEVIFETKQDRIGQNASLGVQEKYIDPVARLHLLHMVRGHGVQQARSVFAGYADSAAPGEIEQARALQKCFMAQLSSVTII